MLVPEAPMYEDYLLSGAKYKIRIARQVTRVEAITVTHPMDKPPNDHLRLGIGISGGEAARNVRAVGRETRSGARVPHQPLVGHVFPPSQSRRLLS